MHARVREADFSASLARDLAGHALLPLIARMLVAEPAGRATVAVCLREVEKLLPRYGGPCRCSQPKIHMYRPAAADAEAAADSGAEDEEMEDAAAAAGGAGGGGVRSGDDDAR